MAAMIDRIMKRVRVKGRGWAILPSSTCKSLLQKLCTSLPTCKEN